MLLRSALALIVSLALFGSLIIFEAAGAAALCGQLLRQASANDNDMVRDRLYKRAEDAVLKSWARPALWHAGAQEHLSALAFARSADRNDLRAARALSEAAIQQAPIQPNAYVRLAALAQSGISNTTCAAEQCLERSWAVAPLLPPEAECTRLRLAADHQRTPARLRNYAHIAGRRAAARCFAHFLTPRETLEILWAGAARPP